MSTQSVKVIIFLIEVLLPDLTCTDMIGLDTGSMSGWGGSGLCLSVMSEATAPRGGGGGWMASEYKVQEKCAHRAVRG